MKHRTLFLIVFALLQTCIAFAGTPFTKEEFQEMVRLFNQHQEANIKKPFDKWTTLPLINKPEGLEVVYLASDDEATGGFFFIDRADSTISVITTYTFPMKFAFYSMSIEGGKIGLKAKSGGGMFFLLDVFCISGQSRVLCFRKRMLRRDRGGYKQHRAKAGSGNSEAHHQTVLVRARPTS